LDRPLILASASPRRAELLRNAGILFEVVVADIPESPNPGERPLDYCRRVAAEKARAIAAKHRDRAVLAADTIVVIDDAILEKPRDADDARAMLRRLSGRTHEVMTGVCLILPERAENVRDKDGATELLEAETTRVHMVEIGDDEIADYIASGEPMDKAGAYAIQGMASRWIPRIEGCYFNVVGLPIPRVYGMLKRIRVR
jgi:septum formation protein